MYHVSAQGVDEGMINVHYYYYFSRAVPFCQPHQQLFTHSLDTPTDMIAIPDFAAGAMENWGLITYRMTSILYDPQKTSASGKQWISKVVAHELAHQVSEL